MAKEYILKDRYGKDHTYNDETIYVRGTDGELMPFTQGTVEPLTITENGTYNAPDGVSYNPVNVNVDPTKVTLLREQRFDGFVLDATYGAYSPGYVTPAQFALKNGEKYYVKWDGTEYECVATAFNYSGMSMVFIGNGTYLGLHGNGEPFLITYNADYDNTQLFSLDADSYHTVGIKQKAPGGSSNDVRYVTFMSHDGLIEYGKKAVAVGDDCADPIARGVFDTPTRESDAQYNYTFYGWATTPNGAANSSALKAVEEDRTVYANFASAVRYYTITYYDSDGTTVLKTESLAYGTVPSYAPKKENFAFGGWTPSAVAVTGNASYTAVWEEKVTFATASWPKITEITTAGTSASNFSVGDTRKETLTYSDGTTEEIELIIAKIRSNGTMVLALNHALNTQKPMHSSASSCVANYFNNDLGNYLENTVLPAFPVEFSKALRENELLFENRKIRLLSETNVKDNNTGKDPTNSWDSVDYEELPLFAKAANRIRKINGTAVTYWTGKWNKPSTSLNFFFNYIDTSGVYTTTTAAVTSPKGVVFLVDV